MWGGDDSTAKDATSLDALKSLASEDAVEAITNATPSPDSLEVKNELLEMESEDEGLNKNGKRRRGDEGDTPGKLLRSPKKVCDLVLSAFIYLTSFKQSRTPRKSPKKKAAASTLPSIGGASPLPSGDEGLDNPEGSHHEEDTVMDKDSTSKSPTNSLVIPLSHGRKSRVFLLRAKKRLSKRARTSEDPPSPAPSSTGDPPSNVFPIQHLSRRVGPPPANRTRLARVSPRNPPWMTNRLGSTNRLSSTGEPESPTVKDLPTSSTQLDDATVLPMSTAENKDEEILPQSPPVPDAEMLRPILTKPWPPKTLDMLASALSIIGSSLPATGNSDISNGSQEGKSISETTCPSGPSMQEDVADSEIVPNTETPDLLPQAPVGGSRLDLRLDTSVLAESSSVYSSSLSSRLPPSDYVRSPTPPMSDSTKLITSPLPASSSSRPLVPNVHEGVPIPDLPSSLPSGISIDFKRPELGSGSGDQDSNDPLGFQQLKADFIQKILDTVRKMTTVPQIEEQQATAGSGSMGTEKRDIAENLTVTSLSQIVSANLASEVDRVETIVGAQSLVEKVVAEENGARGEVTSGKDLTTIVPANSGDAVNGEMKEDEENGTQNEVTNEKDLATIVSADSGSDVVNGEMKEDERGREMVDEPEVVDTMGGLVDDTNGTDVRMESCAVETQPIQSHQETPTVDNMDGVEVAMEKGVVQVQPVQSGHEIHGNDIAGVAVIAVEGQSLDSQSLTTPSAHIDCPNSAHHSMERVSPVGVEGGASQEGRSAHAGVLEDQMIVDEEMVQSIQPMPLADKNLEKDTLFMASAARTKSLHSIRILRDLIRFLRMPARDQQLEMSRALNDKGQGTGSVIGQAHDPLLVGPRLPPMEETISVDQRLDVLAYVSLTLAKNLYPHRGKELETKIDLLDKHLWQQFQMIQQPDGRSTTEPFKEFEARLGTVFDRNTQTISQAVQTSSPHVDRQFENAEIQTEAEDKVSAPQQLLSTDATMVDLTLPTAPLQEPPSTPATPGEETRPDNNNASAITQTVMTMMRNMADLLECTTQGTSHGSTRSLKGKEKEVDDANMVPSYLNSPVLTTILEEFKLMKEDMRRSQHRSQSEVESLRLSHFMEVEALKNEIRNIEGRGKQELDEVTRQYSQQIGELKATIRLREERERIRDREREGGRPGKLPPLDLDIRGRGASLDARSRSDSDMIRSTSRSSMTNGHFVEPGIGRPPHFNPPHEYEDQQPYPTTFRAPTRQYIREGSMSKPGTPISSSDRNPFSSRHPDVIMDLDESMPLPAKSQRKMHMMNFPRPPLG